MANKYSQAKNFKFVGYITFKEDNLLKTKDGSSWRKLSFGITDGNNSQYVEVNEFGAGNTFKVKSPNEDGGYDDLEIMWHERKDESVLENVASFSKKYILGETLIHNHDVIEATYKAIKEGKLTSAKFEDGKVVSGTKISVSGQIKFNYYNGNVNQVYEFSRISIVKEETPCEFTGTISLVFGNKAVKDDAKNKRLIVNGYCAEYNKALFGEKTPTGLLPQTFVLNYEEVKAGEALKKYLLDKLVVKDDKYRAIKLDVNFMRGAKEASTSDFKPTKEQMELVEMGLMTLEEVMEAQQPVGKKVTEVQITKINISGAFAKVIIPTDFTSKNVYREEDEDDIYDVVEEVEEEESIFSSTDEFEDEDLPF